MIRLFCYIILIIGFWGNQVYASSSDYDDEDSDLFEGTGIEEDNSNQRAKQSESPQNSQSPQNPQNTKPVANFSSQTGRFVSFPLDSTTVITPQLDRPRPQKSSIQSRIRPPQIVSPSFGSPPKKKSPDEIEKETEKKLEELLSNLKQTYKKFMYHTAEPQIQRGFGSSRKKPLDFTSAQTLGSTMAEGIAMSTAFAMFFCDDFNSRKNQKASQQSSDAQEDSPNSQGSSFDEEDGDDQDSSQMWVAFMTVPHYQKVTFRKLGYSLFGSKEDIRAVNVKVTTDCGNIYKKVCLEETCQSNLCGFPNLQNLGAVCSLCQKKKSQNPAFDFKTRSCRKDFEDSFVTKIGSQAYQTEQLQLKSKDPNYYKYGAVDINNPLEKQGYNNLQNYNYNRNPSAHINSMNNFYRNAQPYASPAYTWQNPYMAAAYAAPVQYGWQQPAYGWQNPYATPMYPWGGYGR